MVKVAICDDEIAICKELNKALADVFSSLGVEFEVKTFLTGEALCQELEAGEAYSLIFLDIEFAKNEINGVEAGQRIRKSSQNKTTPIVYISWEKKYAMELFDIRPLNFLIKPLEHDKIRQVIHTYLALAEHAMKEFTYKKGNNVYKVPIQEIVYMENDKRKVVIHLANGKTDEFYGSLKDVYDEQLKSMDFLFIHASYLVNYDYVSVVKYNEVLTVGYSAPLPISSGKRNEIREQYLAIIKKRKV